MVAFFECMSRRCQSVVAQLNTSHAAQVEKSMKVLKPIMATVEVCDRQGIALRGHRDDGKHLDVVVGSSTLFIHVGFRLILVFPVLVLHTYVLRLLYSAISSFLLSVCHVFFWLNSLGASCCPCHQKSSTLLETVVHFAFHLCLYISSSTCAAIHVYACYL